MSHDFGLIGGNVAESFSPMLHKQFAKENYRLYSLGRNELADFMRKKDFSGVNVTIPYKQAVIPYLDQLSPRAQRIGSVNTVVRTESGSLYGENTDYDGLCASLDRLGVRLENRKVLVLGSGGTSKTVQTILKDRGALPVVISRRGENHYGNLSLHRDAFGLVNTTPIGMMPYPMETLVDLACFPKLEFVLDVVYRPLRTALLMQAEKRGIPCLGGLTMLVEQAAAAGRLFYQKEIPKPARIAAEAELKRKVSNLVLIGMPGCGKSTLAAMLSRKLMLPVADSDREIVQATGMSIPSFFEQKGESTFRSLERAVLYRLCSTGGKIIATGGGAPLSAINRFYLRMNGFVVYIQRDTDRLSVLGRPLSQGGVEGLCRMELQRSPAYIACADKVIANNTSLEECCDKVAEAYHAYLCD